MSLLISDEIVQASGFSEHELLLEIVIMLFQQDKISLGKASELLEMHRMQFQKLLADRDICIHKELDNYEELDDYLSLVNRTVRNLCLT
ncbi:MAG: UPF0175 family protein [Xenococcus sp. (in: cyanobacteria)]